MDVFALLFIVSFLALVITLTVMHIRCMNKGKGNIGQRKTYGFTKDKAARISLNTRKAYVRSYDLESSMMQREVNEAQDEDGNIMILQDSMYITLTPQQQIALKSLLEAHIDTLQFVWGK